MVTLAAPNLVFSSIAFAIAAAMLLSGRLFVKRPFQVQILAALAVNGFAGVLTWTLLGPSWQLLVPLFLGFFSIVAARRLLKDLSFTGGFLIATQIQFYVACLFWGLSTIVTADVDPLTRGLMSVGYLLVSLYAMIGLVQKLEQMEVICRRDWRRPTTLATLTPRGHYPKVTLHVPTYYEPPDLVIATLDALAALEYPDYEVIVIDNNTRDPALWQPVQTHCRHLGERFRFFHVDDLPGAKAGALNLALRYADPAAELIGVIDSDYKVSRDFIASIVGYFDDPQIGFVQTPQAHRDWEPYSYLRMCNFEYNLYLVSTLVSRNDRMAAITLGTMGLIRRKVLDEVGGWAEWCVTEDSELALRIHACGYESIYVNKVFGRGLIPEGFLDYKKQRFRWTYGAIQELRRHFRLFLPRPLARASALTAMQKFSHLMHAVDTLKSCLEFLMLVVAAMLAVSMLLRGEPVPLPPYVWPVFAAAAILAFSLKWYVFRSLTWSFGDTLGANMAHAALEHTIAMASIAGLLTRNTRWLRTNKFRAIPKGLGALTAVVPELLLGGALSVTCAALLVADFSSSLLFLLSIAGLLKGIKYLLGPVLVILSERGISQRANDSACGAKP